MNSKAVILGSWGAVGAVVTVQWVTSGSAGFPPPGRYLASSVLYSLLFVASAAVPELAATVGVGILMAMLLRPYLQKSSVSVLQQSADWLGKLTGQPATG
jgi:xanthosine utilization system XapX-like protein